MRFDCWDQRNESYGGSKDRMPASCSPIPSHFCLVVGMVVVMASTCGQKGGERDGCERMSKRNRVTHCFYVYVAATQCSHNKSSSWSGITYRHLVHDHRDFINR